LILTLISRIVISNCIYKQINQKMKILKYQFWHFLMLVILLFGIYTFVNADASLLHGEFSGANTSTWFTLAILSPIIHQIYVLICWRLELFYKSISKAFGAKGFKLFKAGFGILIFSRLLTIVMLAISNQGTLELTYPIALLIAGIVFIPSVYLFYSVRKYFGVDRAFGIDHFQPETSKKEPFVKKGIFKYTSNGMYVFGFFILWIPGLLLLSKAALLVALFNHVYIWVHYYFTELPDMKVIYEH